MTVEMSTLTINDTVFEIVDAEARVDIVNIREDIGDDIKGDVVQDIIAQLQGLPVFGTVDENNVITVTSQLTSGTYVLYYEYTDGTVEAIGTIVVAGGDEPSVVVNLLPLAVGVDGEVFNGTGYMNGYYLTGSNSTTPIYVQAESGTAHFATGYMPYTLAQLQAQTPIYIKGVAVDVTNSHERIGFYPSLDYAEWNDPLKLSDNLATVENLSDNYYKITLYADLISEADYPFSDLNYIRFSLSGSGEGVVISVGNEITE